MALTAKERSARFQTEWGTKREIECIEQFQDTARSTRLEKLQGYLIASEKRVEWGYIKKTEVMSFVMQLIKKEKEKQK